MLEGMRAQHELRGVIVEPKFAEIAESCRLVYFFVCEECADFAFVQRRTGYLDEKVNLIGGISALGEPVSHTEVWFAADACACVSKSEEGFYEVPFC